MATENLQNAIDAAAAELAAESSKVTGKTILPGSETPAGDPEVEIVGGEEITEETNEEPNEDADLNESQLIEARNLYRALSGPNAAPIIAALAAQAGLLPKPGQEAPTKTETAAARREIKDIVKEALGPEYAFLQDKIGKIFDEVAAQQEAETESRFAEIQRDRVEAQVIAATNKLLAETKGASKQFENRMAELSGEIPIGNMDVETYMRRIYTLASAEKRPAPQKIADKIRANANDAPNRLKSSVGPVAVPHAVPGKKMNLDEAVNWALGELQKKGK